MSSGRVLFFSDHNSSGSCRDNKKKMSLLEMKHDHIGKYLDAKLELPWTYSPHTVVPCDDKEARFPNMWKLLPRGSEGPLQITSMAPRPGSWYLDQRGYHAYLKKKANLVAQNHSFFDNERTMGTCRLAFELDIKLDAADDGLVRQRVAEVWMCAFNAAIAVLGAEQYTTMHVLAREDVPIYHKSGRGEVGVKVGRHLVFEHIYLQPAQGLEITERVIQACGDDWGIDSVYKRQGAGVSASLRPAYCHKSSKSTVHNWVCDCLSPHYAVLETLNTQGVNGIELVNGEVDILETLQRTSLFWRSLSK